MLHVSVMNLSPYFRWTPDPSYLRGGGAILLKLRSLGPKIGVRIRDFSKVVVFMDFGCLLEFAPWEQFWWLGHNYLFICQTDTHIVGVNQCFWCPTG